MKRYPTPQPRWGSSRCHDPIDLFLLLVCRLFGGFPIGIPDVLLGHDTFDPRNHIAMVCRYVCLLLWIRPQIVQFQRPLKRYAVTLPVIDAYCLLERMWPFVDFPVKEVVPRRLLPAVQRGHDGDAVSFGGCGYARQLARGRQKIDVADEKIAGRTGRHFAWPTRDERRSGCHPRKDAA